MKVAYFHPENTRRPASVRTPMRVALDKAGINVLDVRDHGIGNNNELSVGDRDTEVAELLRSTIKQAADIKIWISEACESAETDRLGPLACEELGVPFVVVEPDPGIAANDHGDVASEIVAQARHIVTTSSATAKYFEKLAPDSLTLLSTFIDADPFRAAYQVRELHKSRFAAMFRLPETSPWLLTDGAMEPGDSMRSYEVLATALSRLVMLDWRLIVVAAGDAVAEARQRMLHLPQERIRYCDPLSHSEYAALCVSCDMYVWPATGNSSPGSLLEAQSSGLPVVTGRKDSTEDRVVDGRTGRLTPIGNAESFANAISFLIRNPGFMQSYGDDARDSVSSKHDLDAIATRLLRVLSDQCQPR